MQAATSAASNMLRRMRRILPIDSMPRAVFLLMRRRTLLRLAWLAATLVAAMGGCAAAKPPRRFEYNRVCMGVRTRIVLYAAEPAQAEQAAGAAFDRIAALDACLSDYRPDSELSRLSDAAGRGPIPASDDLMRMLEASNQVAAASDGGFDVTVGPLVTLWRAARRDGRLPDEAALDKARRKVGWADLLIDRSRGTVELRREGMRLDVGGIGKGFAAQEAVDLLRSRGVNRCLVALAGDIAVGDPPPRDRGWRIDVPGYDGKSADRLLLANAAASTSGDLQQFIEIGGVRYSHIVDPRTGMGVTSRAMATVLAPRGEIADSLSSAACIVAPDRLEGLVQAFPGAAAIVRLGPDGSRSPIVIDPAGRLQWDARSEPGTRP